MYATQFTDQVVRCTALFGSPQELSDEVSDNRDRQRWTPADTHGRSVPGQACCGAGSLHLYLASGRRGRLRCRIGRRSLTSVHCIAELSLTDQGGAAARAAGPASAPRAPPWEARPRCTPGRSPRTDHTSASHPPHGRYMLPVRSLRVPRCRPYLRHLPGVSRAIFFRRVSIAAPRLR